jgi:phage-related baseplate assembly protein
MIKEIERLPDISFIGDVTLTRIQEQLVADYQSKFAELTGTAVTLASGEPITLMLYACAVQFMQMYQNIDKAGKMNFLKYSYGDYLDNLGALKGVERQDEESASCTVRFTLSAPRPSTIAIPAGTRLTTQGANIYFATDEYVEIRPGSTTVDVTCTAMISGAVGNGYEIGDICVLVDPIPYISTSVNITASAGGMARESDESLADRIYLAPANYSVAGPEAAYEYFAKAAYSGVRDVMVMSPDANLIDIRVIGDGGAEIPAEVCSRIKAYLEDGQIKPMGDVITNVSSPTTEAYDIDITYYINRSDTASVAAIQAAVDEAVDAYIEWQSDRIGRDIEPGKLIELVMAAGAKRVVVTEPTYTATSREKIARLSTRTVNYGGVEDD